MIHFTCPTCHKVLKILDNGAGRKISCPQCGQRMLVPSPVKPAAANKTVLAQLTTAPLPGSAPSVHAKSDGLVLRGPRKDAELKRGDGEASAFKPARSWTGTAFAALALLLVVAAMPAAVIHHPLVGAGLAAFGVAFALFAVFKSLFRQGFGLAVVALLVGGSVLFSIVVLAGGPEGLLHPVKDRIAALRPQDPQEQSERHSHRPKPSENEGAETKSEANQTEENLTDDERQRNGTPKQRPEEKEEEQSSPKPTTRPNSPTSSALDRLREAGEKADQRIKEARAKREREPAPTEAQALPSDLAKIPSDAAFILSGRVADLWNSDFNKSIRQKMVKEMEEGNREFEKQFGMPIDQVERMTMVMLDVIGPGEEEPPIFLRTVKPYDREKLLAALGKVREVKYKDHTLFGGDKKRVVLLLDKHSVVFIPGRDDAIRGLLDRTPPKIEGNLAGALRLAAGKHSVVCGLNVKAFHDAAGDKLPGEIVPFKPLLQALHGTMTVDLGAESRADVKLTFATEKDAKAALNPARTGLDLARAGLDGGVKALSKQKEMAKIVELLKQVQEALKTTQAEQEGKTLQASARLKVDAADVGLVLLEAVQKVREAAKRTQSQNNLKQIGLAMHNVAATYNGRLPPQATYDKDGKPMLSWRVLILPYIEQNALYNQFHLNEPWDSEHNKKLLEKMPKTYASPQDETTLKDHTTHYQGFFGKGAFFEGKKGLLMPADFTDGTSNTLMILEASKAVPWTKPEDIPYDPAKPLPKLGLPGAAGFFAGMCDGSVRFVPHKVSEKTLRSAITRNGGENLGPDW